MARLGITRKSINKFIKKLEKASEALEKDMQEKLLREIRADAETVIENHSEEFILPSERIPEFGVGKEGQPDENAAANAWRALLPNPKADRAQVTNIKFKKTKGVFGFNFSISDKFYEIDGLTSYLNDSYRSFERFLDRVVEERDEGPEIIPWMKWYIEGHETLDYSLKEGEHVGGSRTGKALMVHTDRSGDPFWSTKKRPDVWPNLNEDLQKQLKRTVIKFMDKYDFKF